MLSEAIVSSTSFATASLGLRSLPADVATARQCFVLRDFLVPCNFVIFVPRTPDFV